MSKPYRAVPAEEVLGAMSPERQARIAARTTELIGEELGLGELRKRRQVTQQALAEKLGGRQVYISRLEKRSDLKLSTLRDYVQALGGELQLVVSFPDEAVTINPPSPARAERQDRPPQKRKIA